MVPSWHALGKGRTLLFEDCVMAILVLYNYLANINPMTVD